MGVPSNQSDGNKLKPPTNNINSQESCSSNLTVANENGRNEVNIDSTGKCPFRHGTVYAYPYPGYAHGNPNRGICPSGCRPSVGPKSETHNETLLREAMEFLEIYYNDRHDEMKDSKGFLPKEERMAEVKTSIEETGSYEQTFDELEHGARVAWRNAPKCSNRKYWEQLKLLDCRGVETNEGIFRSCVDHICKAMACGSSECYISIFKPAIPGTLQGPRIWNEQLLSYASYRSDDGGIVGDPKNLRFTEMLKERFDWSGPQDGIRSPFDYIPLVIQADPEVKPELFELPLEIARPVHLNHPRYPTLTGMNLQWYPIPAVSALDLTVGGLVYTAAPFNGWYADTEVLRDLTDECRYNLLVPIAKALGFDTNAEAPLWKDEVMSILNKVIYYSYKKSKVAMVDHHTLINMFYDWYQNEMSTRKFCPVNWKWVIPPMSSSTSKAYLGLNKAQEYTLKPAYIVGAGFRQLEVSFFGDRCLQRSFQSLKASINAGTMAKAWARKVHSKKQAALIIYASVTGNAAKYASELGDYLSMSFKNDFIDACRSSSFDETKVVRSINSAELIVFVTSTQGNGDLPSTSKKFFSFLFNKCADELAGKECAVLGFGSSAYPVFCGGAAVLSRHLSAVGAIEVIPRGECDAIKGEAMTFHQFLKSLVGKLASHPLANSLVLKLNDQLEKSESNNCQRRRDFVQSVKIEVFSKEEIKLAAGDLLTSRRRSNGFDDDNSRSLNRLDMIKQLVENSLTRDVISENCFGAIKEKDDIIIGKDDHNVLNGNGRRTCLIKIDLKGCGSPPYEPGDHVRVFPRNIMSKGTLQNFLDHLKGDLFVDDQIYVSFADDKTAMSTLKVHAPLLVTVLDTLVCLEELFIEQAAVLSTVSMEACQDLSFLAQEENEQKTLMEFGWNEEKYDEAKRDCGMKWIQIFDLFPSLSKMVSLEFLLCNLKSNHARSYSVSSCKATVGSELHLIVGRFLYSQGDKIDVGVCSNYLTSSNQGDEIKFCIESVPSFHYPGNSSSPVIFICTGTGYAPIRGLLQKRQYFHSRGEILGPAYLIFGSRRIDEGVFFQREIEGFEGKDGILTKTFFCYSREPGKEKEYTSDVLKSGKCEDLLRPIAEMPETHVFICGSAKMAEGCKQALRAISSPSCIDTMEKENRLHCDVFGAISSSSN